MNAAKKLLEETIRQLDDEQTKEVLAFVRQLREDTRTTLTIDRLRGDEAFKVPPELLGWSSRIEPIRADGPDAAELLIKERR